MRRKTFTLIATLLITVLGFSQKYVLIDKKMAQPLAYADVVSLEQGTKGLFAVEKAKLPEFLAAVDKIVKQLNEKKIPESIDFKVGITRFHGLQIPLKDETRMDVLLTTESPEARINMHLCDAKNSNASNAYFITTWLKYIRSNLGKK